MGTEVLRPEDCLIERIRVPPAALLSRRRNYGYPNPIYYNSTKPNRRPAVRHEKPDQRRQRAQSEPSMSKKSTSYDDSRNMTKRSSSDDLKMVRSCGGNSNDLVMEKVMLLRRGQSLDSKIKKEGRAPEMMSGKCDVYAGSGFAVSPAPSSLPLPSFFRKEISIDDSATRDIKRLLRLDL